MRLDAQAISYREVFNEGTEEEFSLVLRNPTFQEILEDHGIALGLLDDRQKMEIAQIENRLKTCVVDWENVVDAQGDPIPYSYEQLQSLCVQFPGVFQTLAIRLQNSYNRIRPPKKSKASSVAT